MAKTTKYSGTQKKKKKKLLFHPIITPKNIKNFKPPTPCICYEPVIRLQKQPQGSFLSVFPNILLF